MCEVHLLAMGYSAQINDVAMVANCSCTLIKGVNKNIIVDTMTAWDREYIIEALADHGVRPENINYVVCSHSHADHIGNNHLFLNANEHIVGVTVQRKTLFYNKNIKNCDYKLCDGVKITATPGHTAEDVTVIVNGKFKGEEVTVAITGDLFEKEEDLADPTIWKNLGTPELQEVQANSRCKIANIADIIIPGHGPPFHVTEEIRNQLNQQLEEIKSEKQ